MPLRLPDRLPAIDILKGENIFVMDETRAHNQEIRPLRIVILNLMPLKITTETDLIRLLKHSITNGYLFHEIAKSHAEEYSCRAYDDVLQVF